MTLSKINKVEDHISVSLLAECVQMDETTGRFTWKERPVEHFLNGSLPAEVRQRQWNGKYAGKEAFIAQDPRGYRRGVLNQQVFYAHRAVVALRDGRWPQGEVDHINRNKQDNRPENLRVVSHAQNRINSADCAKLTSGVYRSGKVWRVQIKANGRAKHIGSFACLGQAIVARLDARHD